MPFSFDLSTADAIRYGDINAMEGLSAASWALHHYPTDLTSNGRRLFAKGDGTTASDPWHIDRQASGVVRLRIGDGAASTVVTSTTAMSLNQDNSMVFSWDGSNVRIVVNGTDDGTFANTRVMNSNTTEVAIGSPFGLTAAAAGYTAHVMMWSVALTAEEMQSYHAGHIPRPDKLIFWQPCWAKTMPDLIQGASPTEVGTVSLVDAFALKVPTLQQPDLFPGTGAITALFKVLSETEQLTEGDVRLMGILQVLTETEQLAESPREVIRLLKFIAETEQLSEVSQNLITTLLAKIVSETLQLQDGDNNNLFDPAGKLTETMSDGTIWTTVFPPFTKRTKWTNG